MRDWTKVGLCVLLAAAMSAWGQASKPATAPISRPATHADDEKLELLWTELMNADGATALDAVKSMESNGDRAVTFLRKKMSPISHLDAAAVQQLINHLDAPQYALRQRATDELSLWGSAIIKALNDAQGAPKSQEDRIRLEALVENADNPVGTIPAAIRWRRATRVLERIGTPEARKLLDELGKGDQDARATQQAQEALLRLASGPGADRIEWWLARAEEEVEALDASGWQPPHYFGEISSMLSDAGLIKSAVAMQRRSKGDLEALYHLASAYARVGLRKEGLDVASQVMDPGGRTELNCRVGVALAFVGQVEPSVQPQASADWMAATVAHALSAEQADKWKVRETQEQSAQARIYAAIATAHAAAGRMDLYRKHIELAEGLTDKIAVDINEAWGAALSGTARQGPPGTDDVLAAIDKTNASEAIALARARVGDYDGAREALKRLPAGRYRDARTRILAEYLANSGQMKEARATADGIEDKIHRDLALLSVVGGCLRIGARDGAQAAADKLQTEAYQAAARLAMRLDAGDEQDYQEVARYDSTLRLLARIQAQTPGRDRAAIFKWIQRLPQSAMRYHALLGAAGGVMPPPGGPPSKPATQPAASTTSSPATHPGSDPASTQPVADAAEVKRPIKPGNHVD